MDNLFPILLDICDYNKWIMKTINLPLWIVSIALVVACSSNDEEQMPFDNGHMCNTAILHLNGAIQHFDAQTRVATSEWNDGAKLYIQYHTEKGKVYGAATYDASSDEWTVQYQGTLTRNETTACEVYYFENPVKTTVNSVTLNMKSAIFSDSQATYIYKDGVVLLKTLLMPQTGRIRFRGKPGCRFSMEGLEFYSEYHFFEDKFSTNCDVTTITVNEDGYTPYIYSNYANESEKRIVIYDPDSEYLFYKDCDNTSILSTGKSGFLDMPTLQISNGWVIKEGEPLCPDDNHPHKIDMGNGVKWACCNVGVNYPGAGGYCYAWGETVEKNDFTRVSYEYTDSWNLYYLTKYYTDDPDYGKVDNITQLELADDVAHVKWKGTWRMPTHEEFLVLLSDCTWILSSCNGFKGYRARATNGNSIFFPFVGLLIGTQCKFNNEKGGYWSSTLDTFQSGCECAYCIILSEDDERVCVDNNDSLYDRWYGLTVRPVSD